MKNSAITRIISFISLLLILSSSLVFSQIIERQITNGGFQQTNPVIWDNLIVYQDGRNTTAIPWHLQDMIRVYNRNTDSDTTVYFLPYHQTYPDVWNNKVVWSERQNIYMYDLIDRSIRNICTADGKQDFPKIEGNYIVWQDERSSTSDPGIFMFDLAADNEIEITDNFTAKDEYPDISGHFVIWVRENTDIYIYDITSGQTSHINPTGYIGKAAIYGSMIVWESNVNNYYQIFMYNIDTQQTSQITSGEFNHMHPAISGKGVVWEDYRNSLDGYSNTDIYFYDFIAGNEVPICTEEHEQKSPNIFDNKIVWQDNRNGFFDIYMAEVQEANGADLEITMTDDPDPVVKDYYETFTIKVFNHGPETAQNVKVKIKLPETYFSFVSILSSQGDCSQFTINDTCYLGNIAKGDFAIITLLTKAIGFLDVNTTAFVNAENIDPNLDNNSVEVNTTISGLFSKYVGRGIYPKIAVDSLKHPKISYTAVPLLGDINYSYINLLDWERELVLWGKPWLHHPLIGYNSDIFVDKNNLPHIVYSFDRNTPDAFGVLSEQYKSLIYTNRENDRWLYYKEIYFCKSVVNGILTNKGTWSPNIVLDKSGYSCCLFKLFRSSISR